MGRGVARPDLREQLFAATDRIMARGGAVGLTSRAITDEAGCAKGILHNHFDGLDGFLTEFAVDRLSLAMTQLSRLTTQAGRGDVVDNLTDAAVALFGSGAVPVAALMTARPALMERICAVVGEVGAGLHTSEKIFAGYLTAERDLGRIPADLDVQVLAFALVGSVHHLFFTNHGTGLDRARVHQIVAMLLRR